MSLSSPPPTPRTIAVVTGTRAEAGLLQSVMRAIDDHPALTLRCVVAGMHLVNATHRDLAFPIAAEVKMQQRDRVGRQHDATAFGRGVQGFARAFATLAPDVVVVLGDRIEAFAAASSASVGGYLVAHLHGGDRAEGVADEAMRHAISKLAHLHFPATVQSRRRLIRMGEAPALIFNHGSPAVDGLHTIAAADDTSGGGRVIVMQHPIGDDDETERQHMRATLDATACFNRLILAPNHDPGRDGITQALRDAGVEVIDHLPRHVFVAQLKAAQLIVGNSSAGLIEAAVCKTPTVNLGPRQGGRETPNSVVSCDYGNRAVSAAIRQALTLDRKTFRHPYGRGDTGQRIAATLATLPLPPELLRKRNAY